MPEYSDDTDFIFDFGLRAIHSLRRLLYRNDLAISP